MRALILAAGRGERLRPLTDHTPKPLLQAGSQRLIEWQIGALARAGVRHIVVNTAHLSDQFEPALGDGSRWGVSVHYSHEGTLASDALETRGGIIRALPLLGEEPFIVTSGDIYTDFDYSSLLPLQHTIKNAESDGHVVLVDNPPYHPRGDLQMAVNPTHPGRFLALPPAADSTPLLTYANIAVLSPRLFQGLEAKRAKLFPWLFETLAHGRTSASHWTGVWWNIGTSQDLQQLNAYLAQRP